MKAIVHVNQHHIKHNRKQSKSDNPKYKPVITVKYGGNDKPLLSCGARVVIQTDSDINIIR